MEHLKDTKQFHSIYKLEALTNGIGKLFWYFLRIFELGRINIKYIQWVHIDGQKIKQIFV